MKVSVSLPAEDLEFLDGYASLHALGSRSAAVQQAIRALRITELGDSYQEAWDDWADGPDAGPWERTSADGA